MSMRASGSEVSYNSWQDIFGRGDQQGQSVWMMWLKIDGSSGSMQQVFYRTDYRRMLDVLANGTQLQFVWGDGITNFFQCVSDNPSSLGTGWHHIACGIRNSANGEVMLWIDGVAQTAVYSYGTGSGGWGDGNEAKFANAQGGARPFNGYIVDFRYYPQAMTDAEVMREYRNGFIPHKQPKAHLPFQDGGSTTANHGSSSFGALSQSYSGSTVAPPGPRRMLM